MPSLKTAVTTDVVQRVKIAPRLRTKLVTALRTYSGLKTQLTVLEAAMKKVRVGIEDILTEVGESNLAIDGYKTTLVAPMRSALSREKLIANGVTVQQINDSTEQIATTPYIRITPPGQRELPLEGV